MAAVGKSRLEKTSIAGIFNKGGYYSVKSLRSASSEPPLRLRQGRIALQFVVKINIVQASRLTKGLGFYNIAV